MTPEQIEKTMQFILETQARLEASVQKHDEAIAALEKHIGALDKHAARHNRDIQELTNLVGRLATAETHLVERMDGFSERMNALTDAQKESAERLNALISVVERYIVGRDGGQKPAP